MSEDRLNAPSRPHCTTLRQRKLAWLIENVMRPCARPVAGSPMDARRYTCQQFSIGRLHMDAPCELYSEAFPSREIDTDLTKAAAGLRRLLNQLLRAHRARRFVAGVYCEDLGDHPGWTYQWEFRPGDVTRYMRGEITAEDLAREWDRDIQIAFREKARLRW